MKPLLERLRGGMGGLQWLALLAGILAVALLNLLLTLLLPVGSHAEVAVNIVAAVLAAAIAPPLLRAVDRMGRRVERQNAELRSLHAIDSAVNGQLNLQAILDVAVRETTLAVDGEVGALWLLDPADPQRVTAQTFYNIPPDRQYMVAEHLDRTSGPAVRASGKAQRLQELDSTWPTDRAARLLRLRSTLTVPIKQQDSLLGLLLIGNRGGASLLTGFTDEDEALLVATASTLSVALQNARLYEETQRRGETMRALVAATGEAVAASSDARRLMQILADAAAHILDCARVAVYAYNTESPRLSGGAQMELQPLAFRDTLAAGDTPPDRRVQPLQVATPRLLLVAGIEDSVAGTVRYVPNVGETLGQSAQEAPALHAPGYLFVLRSRDRRGIGLLCLLDASPRPPSPDRDAFAQALAAQASVGLENALLGERLAAAAERDRHVAEVFQQSMLPSVPAQIGQFEFAHKYQAALEESTLGGDFYDLFDLGAGWVGVVMADVSGKGLKAAVQTAMVKYMLRGFAHESPLSPERVLTHVNDVLSRHSSGFEGFVTLFFGVLNTDTGEFTYCNAGHEPPLCWERAGGSVSPLTGESGLPVGSMPGGQYQPETRTLAPGDLLLLYTDGLPEARSPQGEFLGTDGLGRLLARSEGDAPQIVESVYGQVGAFAGSALRDDVALLLLRRAV